MAASRWLNFFKDAGIPNGPASEYAVIFSDNRMRMDMLNELQKEILQDLGIKIMGDILAILRHSKKVYAEISRSAAEEFDVNKTKSSEQSKKTSTDRMYSDIDNKKLAMPENKPEGVHRKKPSVQTKDMPVLKPVSKPAAEKSRIESHKAFNANRPAGKSLSERFAEFNPVPSKKKKNDANEMITISIPMEKEETREQLTKKENKHSQEKVADTEQIAKKNVFDRLGASTEKTEAIKATKPIPITFQNVTRTTLTPSASSTKEVKTGVSVFKRLGDSVFNTALPDNNAQTARSEKFLTTATKPISSSRSAFSGTRSDNQSMKLGLHGSTSVLRPIKSVKPIPRKPLAMDLEASVQTKTLKSASKQKNNAKLKVDVQHERKTGSKSVFDRLGK